MKAWILVIGFRSRRQAASCVFVGRAREVMGEMVQVELEREDWLRVLAAMMLTASEQDQRILDALRRALTNGDHHAAD